MSDVLYGRVVGLALGILFAFIPALNAIATSGC
jgi:hypothetical protein